MKVIYNTEEQKQIAEVAKELAIPAERVEERLRNVYLANFEADLDWVREMFEEDRDA